VPKAKELKKYYFN